MPLQESLRELVASRGAGVALDATEFRGALDDFLGEDEATTGELNLLVDAVRLGGLTRLVSLLDAGASPQAAVSEAGAALARDRGSDDDRRSRWAVAVLGYALGRLDAASVPTQGITEDSGSTPTSLNQGSVAAPPPPPPRPSTPPGAAAPPSDPSGTVYADAVPGHGPGPDRPTMPAGPLASPGGPPLAPPAPARRRGVGLVVLAIALVLGLAAGVGFAVWQTQRGDDSAGSAGGSRSDSSGDNSSGRSAAAIPADEILIPYQDDAGLHLYTVNAETGEWASLTNGSTDDLPTISPDRTEFTYLDRADGSTVLTLRHVGSRRVVRPFPATDECGHALRPGWSPDGTTFALACLGGDNRTDGIFLSGSDGSNPEEVLAGADFRGSPTWVDEDTFVYGRQDPDTRAMTFSTYRVSTHTSTPLALPTDPGANVTHADWSEEAHELLFLVHDDDEEYGQLWVADADLGNARRLGTTEYAHPVWSPDGTRIAAIWHAPDGSEKLVVVDPQDPDHPDVLADHHPQPDGDPGIPVWASR